MKLPAIIALCAAAFLTASLQGQVILHQDPLVDTLLHRHGEVMARVMENPDHKAIPGYRIQIFFDSGLNSSDRARIARLEFEARHPDIPAYITWKAPNYRVRVGDFRSRLEAEKVLKQVMTDYPNAWVIKDEINFPKQP
jgi:hypothetical protein